MAWEWLAPTVTGVLGVAGMASTVLVARGARGAQAESEKRTLLEMRHRDLVMRRQVAYADFAAAVRRAALAAELETNRANADADYLYDRPDVTAKVGAAMELAEHARLVATDAVAGKIVDLMNEIRFVTGIPRRNDPEVLARHRELRSHMTELVAMLRADLDNP